jgi:aminotransferase
MTTSRLTSRVQSIPFSSIRRVFEKARQLESEGVDIARMEIGRPDFDTPQNIKEAATAALNAGKVHYAPNSGIAPLRESISRKLARENGLNVPPEDVLVTVGCKEAVFLALAALIEPGVEVLIPDPCWDSYSHTVEFFGGAVRTYTLDQAFQPDPESIERMVSPRTRVIVVVSPHNPTGAVWHRQRLEAIAEIAYRHDLVVISDEIYEKIIYGDAEHVSIASLPGMTERTLVINGFSKAYAMDGWRIGYAAGAPWLVKAMLKAHQYTTNCVTTFVQWAAVEAYDGPQDTVDAMVREFDRRRRLIIDSLAELPGVELVPPTGAFYVFPRFEVPGVADDDLATFLLVNARIACVPGRVFGASGEGHLRLSYATSYESIAAGLNRLSEILYGAYGG